jgi:hypothetical protein
MGLYAKVWEIESQCAQFKQATSLNEVDFINGIAILTALELSHVLLANEANLLSTLYEIFSNFALNYANKLSSTSHKLPGMRWLQVFLSNTFSSDLEIVVKHKCYGAVLYRKGGDIVHALSKALGELKAKSKKEADVRKEIHSLQFNQASSEDISADYIITVCQHINKLINANIKKIIEKYQNNLHWVHRER